MAKATKAFQATPPTTKVKKPKKVKTLEELVWESKPDWVKNCEHGLALTNRTFNVGDIVCAVYPTADQLDFDVEYMLTDFFIGGVGVPIPHQIVYVDGLQIPYAQVIKPDGQLDRHIVCLADERVSEDDWTDLKSPPAPSKTNFCQWPEFQLYPQYVDALILGRKFDACEMYSGALTQYYEQVKRNCGQATLCSSPKAAKAWMDAHLNKGTAFWMWYDRDTKHVTGKTLEQFLKTPPSDLKHHAHVFQKECCEVLVVDSMHRHAECTIASINSWDGVDSSECRGVYFSLTAPEYFKTTDCW